MELDNQVIERLAEAAHEIYCNGLRARGETNVALVPYAELPENLKEQNRNNVRDIANKLAHIGYSIRPARGKLPAFNLSARELEKLAEMEHQRWVKEKLEDGWCYAPKTNQTKQLHNALIPWRKLPDAEKEKDRDLVRGIPRILARAGYTITKAKHK